MSTTQVVCVTDERLEQMVNSLFTPALGMIVFQGKDLSDIKSAVAELRELRKMVRVNYENEVGTAAKEG